MSPVPLKIFIMKCFSEMSVDRNGMGMDPKPNRIWLVPPIPKLDHDWRSVSAPLEEDGW